MAPRIVNLLEIKKSLGELRMGLKGIRTELEEHFANLDGKTPDDRHAKKMWRFLGEATDRLADLVDDVTLAESTYTDVLKYYGEDDKNMQSSEFYGIFKTFVTSYKVKIGVCGNDVISSTDVNIPRQKCQNDNEAAANEKAAAERRIQHAEEQRAARSQAAAEKANDPEADTSVLDTLLEKLRNGDSVRKRGQRKPGVGREKASDATSIGPGDASTGADTAGAAKELLAALKQDGFAAFVPTTPRAERDRTAGGSSRRKRLKSTLSISSSPVDFGGSESEGGEMSAGGSARNSRPQAEDILEEPDDA